MTHTKKELRNYLKDLLKGKAELTNFSFEYQSGHTSYYSRLRITVTSDKIVHWKIPKGTPVDITKEKKSAKPSLSSKEIKKAKPDRKDSKVKAKTSVSPRKATAPSTKNK